MHQARSIFNISSTLDSQQSAALQQLQPLVQDKAVRHRYRHLKGLLVLKKIYNSNRDKDSLVNFFKVTMVGVGQSEGQLVKKRLPAITRSSRSEKNTKFWSLVLSPVWLYV